MSATNGDINGATNGHTNGATNGESPQLPSAKPYKVSEGIQIQPPLTRRGHGPGLVLLIPEGIDTKFHEKTLDPPPLQKWAEEGWAVAEIRVSNDDSGFQKRLNDALAALQKLDVCDTIGKTGLIAIDVRDSHNISKAIDATDEIVAVISYGSSTLQTCKPQLSHITRETPKIHSKADSKSKTYHYPDTGSYFIIPSHDDFKSAPAAVSHTRCLTFFKPLTNGPWFDLEALWDEHTAFEFGERNVEKTMATMVQEPYVNHIPTITGGIGREKLTHFYTNHFVFNNPEDTALELVSRTVGIDRVIDEFVFSFTHDRMIDWLAPGIPSTGKTCELPFTSVVNIRGDRLYHEHIGWDQATMLKQMGLMPEYLPFPYPINGKEPAQGKVFEYKVPTAGVETSRKLVDERSVGSNGMFEFKVREVDAK